MIKRFLDTNVLLKGDLDEIGKSKFIISNITFMELEGIKNDSRKDFDVKTKAQHVSRWLAENEKRYEVSLYSDNLIAPLKELGLEINNDVKILACAYSYGDKVTLVTDDLNMYNIAKGIIPRVQLYKPTPDTYYGFKKVTVTEEELAELYENPTSNKYELLVNEYLTVFDESDNWISSFKWNGEQLVEIQYQQFKSRMFGTVKALDCYQKLAMDSLKENQLTVLRGPAGSGKSYLALSYLFGLLEKGDIDKIVIFVNTPAAKGACKLGFYPGTKDEKLLSSTVGNILCSKLGGMEAVEMLIADGRLELLPMADIRGYDTGGVPVGLWIVEAQNTSKYLMQLALQRVGDDTKVIIDGDNATQVDMAEFDGEQNGMRAVSKVFRGEKYYGEVALQRIHRGRIAERAQLIEI